MVCPRCITVVRDALTELGLTVHEIALGEATVASNGTISPGQINTALKKHGFELIESRDRQQVNAIKATLEKYITQLEESETLPVLSHFLSEELHQNYSSLSSTFSAVEDLTIEKYVIHLKIARVKALLGAGDLTLSEIAWKLNYSSVAHLSGQFKQITGISPTQYQKQRAFSSSEATG